MNESDNMTDVVSTGPSAVELSALLEKQNEVLSALVSELETCKSEVLILRKGSSQQKQVCAEDTWKNIAEIGEIAPDGSKNFLILEVYLEEIKKAHLKAENLSRELEIARTELSHATEKEALKQIHIDNLKEFMEKERKARNDEFSKLTDCLADKTREFDDLNTENKALKMHLKILEDSIIAKEKLINDLTEATAKELAKRNEEDKLFTARLSVLANENTTLRASLLTLGVNELSPQSKKLLKQQQDFIETLKSECEILMDRLVKERNVHRKDRKQLQRQIRILNARLESLISGKEEIIEA